MRRSTAAVLLGAGALVAVSLFGTRPLVPVGLGLVAALAWFGAGSVGGEEPPGTIASVYAWNLARGGWRRLPDLPTSRHGLGVVAIGTRVYAVAGGPEPGLTVSGANEYLDLR